MALERHTVQLTEEERNQRAREAASALREYTRAEGEAKEQARIAREEMQALRKQADVAAKAAATGVEEREVEVRREADNDHFRINTFRVDTGERVDSRPMTEDEMRVARQGNLPLRQGATVSPLRGNTRGGQPS